MNPLDAFLSADLDVKKKVHIDRLGVDLEVKALSTKEFKEISEQASFGGEIDEHKIGALAIAKSCVNMDFNDAKLKDKFGVITADECVSAALLPGEAAELQKAIMEISGFKAMEAQVKEAKN